MDHLLPNSQNKNTKVLFQLAALTKAKIIHRPSKKCKSPYVTDVLIDENNNTTLTHSPSLGCCGLCANERVVMIQPLVNTKSKCTHRILLSEMQFGDKEKIDKIYIATHPRLAEDVVNYALQMDLIDSLKGHRTECVKHQITFGNSRFDFSGIGKSGRPFLLEVKSVPLADYENIGPKERKKKGL